MKYFLLFLFSIIFSMVSYTQPKPGMRHEPGKCYAKCLISDQYEQKEFTIFEYAGQDFTSPYIVEEIFLISNESLEWVKNKLDPNCLSENKNDCLLWQQQKINVISEKIYIVKDTNRIKDFKKRTISRKILVKEGGFGEWREIVCGTSVTPKLIQEVKNALVAKGYWVDINVKTLDKDAKSVLLKYQEDNKLPIGPLDFETLRSLGISIQ
jgi:hypothetical protein